MKTSATTIPPYHADFVDFIEGKIKEIIRAIGGDSPKLQTAGATQPASADAPHAHHTHHAVSKHPKARRHAKK